MTSTQHTEGLSFVEGDQENENNNRPLYIVGWRLHAISLGSVECTEPSSPEVEAENSRLLMSLFMSQLESTIMSTSIVNITNDLGGYGKSSWVFTAYLVTYSGW